MRNITIEKLTTYSELFLKLFSALFITSGFIGLFIAWHYLNENNIPSVINELLFSPQLLSAIAIAFFLGATSFVFIFFAAPLAMQHLHSKVKFSDGSHVKSLYWCDSLMLLCLIILLTAIICSQNTTSATLGVLLTPLAMALFSLTVREHHKINLKQSSLLKELAKKIIDLYFIFFFIVIGMSLAIAIAWLLCTKIIDNNNEQYAAFAAFLVVYNFVIIPITSSSSIKLAVNFIILPYVIFFATVFYSIVISGSLSMISFGAYTTSLAIDAKSISAIPNKPEYKIEEKCKDACILNDVWVVASLPNKIIIKANKNSSNPYSIPKSAIIAEFGEEHVNNK